MDNYEEVLIKRIEELKYATSPLQKSCRNVLLKLLGELQNQKKKSET